MAQVERASDGEVTVPKDSETEGGCLDLWSQGSNQTHYIRWEDFKKVLEMVAVAAQHCECS